MTSLLDAPSTTLERDESGPVPVTTGENLVTLLGGIWLTLGLFIDGYAHSNIIDTATEDFFTPWHGIFYSGFTFTAAWIGFLMYRRRRPGGIRGWIPAGYEWAVVGLGAFALGGVGDGIWHTVFGVETGLDALLSPTHLVLLYGLLVILAAPFQAVVQTGGRVWVAVVSVLMVSLLAAFFTTFARPLGRAWGLSVAFDPPLITNNETFVAWNIAGVLVTSTIMAVSALFLLQRFDTLPTGALTLLWTVPAVFEAVALSDTVTSAAVAGITAGVTAEILLRAPIEPRRRRISVALTAGTVAGWAAWTLFAWAAGDGVEWAAEVWSGQIILSGFFVAALCLLVLPAPDGSDAHPRLR